MSKFDVIDAAIIEKITHGRTRFVQISLNSDLEKLSAPLAAGLHAPAWRVIDRRLQALRKSGRIAYDTKNGWSVCAPSSERRVER